MNYLGLASVNNISRFLKCINYKQKKPSTVFYYSTFLNIIWRLKFYENAYNYRIKIMKLRNFLKSFQINLISWLNEKIFGLKSLVLRFGLKSRRLDVRHPLNLCVFENNCYLNLIYVWKHFKLANKVFFFVISFRIFWAYAFFFSFYSFNHHF